MSISGSWPAQQLSLPLYRVQLEVFEGPLDLLLHLIKKNEVDITDIPVSVITEQYLHYLDLLQELHLDVAGEFLVMAATLLLIKSRMLLPGSDQENGEEPDPRRELVQQLLEYQRYREAALALAERPLLHRDVFARPPSPPTDVAEARPLRLRVRVWDLVEALKAVLARRQTPAPHVIPLEPISVRECAEHLIGRLRTAGKLAFHDLFEEDASRLRVVATFVALLELLRLGAVCAYQREFLGPIEIELVREDVEWLRLEEREVRGSELEESSAHVSRRRGDERAESERP